MVFVCTELQVDGQSGCQEGAIRQAKCIGTETVITQFCKDGIWQTSAEEEAKCGGRGDLFTWFIAAIIIIMFVLFFYKGE